MGTTTRTAGGRAQLGRRASVARGVLVAVLAVSAACTSSPRTGQEGSGQLPVEYSILPWVRALGGPDPLASPPGANDFSCRPRVAHPNPVVLVHGFVATRAYWQTLSPLLANHGYCVFALTYGQLPGQPHLGGFAPMERSAQELDLFIDRVLAATGAKEVDLVGHSEGTVMPQHYLKRLGGAKEVERYVALAPLYDGTTMHGIDGFLRQVEEWPLGLGAAVRSALDHGCPSCRQLMHGSDFLADLYADGVVAVPGVTYTTIMSRYDELVTPYTSGVLDAPGVTDVVIQDGCEVDFAEHGAVAWTPRALGYVLNALDPAHATPPPCWPTVYGFGVLDLLVG
jgi:triacylglycerol esterase/lipase EstA (alpha/beta hydrolase family)